MSINIKASSVEVVFKKAMARVSGHEGWMNALTKAKGELEKGLWSWDGKQLKIHSRTANQWYTVRLGRCHCKAAQRGLVCWHKAAYGLLSRAQVWQAKNAARAAAVSPAATAANYMRAATPIRAIAS